MRLKPIFDTNIFGLGDKEAEKDWQFLLKHRPRHGWPLSLITVLELLAGLDGIQPDRYTILRTQAQRAFDLSKGRVLEDPMPMLCREVLHIAFPPRLQAPSSSLLSQYLDLVRRATTPAELLKGVPYRGWRAGFNSNSVVGDILRDLKKQWVNALEEIATAKNPEFRELFKTEGRRLSPELRRQLEPRSVWKNEERVFMEHLLEGLLDTKPEPALTQVMVERFSAVLEFSMFVLREFLIGNYSIEKHASDVFDQFQLRYLAMDQFVIVSNDPDFPTRTARSSQGDRIISFPEFLETL